MTVITDWNAKTPATFGKEAMGFRHALHERPMFSDEGLIEVLDRYPRDQLGVFTMGEDPVDWRTWRRGAAEGVSGRELFEGVQSGRLWLNLRAANRHIASYQDLAGEIFADLEANIPGLKTFRHDVGLLISSPRAHVFYHFDATPVTLWQIRGHKRMWVYPVEQPFISHEQMEGLVLKERAEQMPFDLSWDARADVFDLEPGVMVSWPQNAPHRLVNGDSMNVSLSIEYLTPEALMRANMLYANGLLRRRLGATPTLKAGMGPTNLAKFGLARAAKALDRRPVSAARPKVHFRVEPGAPGVLTPL